MIGAGVKAKCRNCGCEAPVGDFKLHYEIKQMVCSKCYTGKSKKEEPSQAQPQEKPKPRGWDKDDEYLERALKMRQMQNNAHFTRVPGSDQVKCTCINCKYVFNYDSDRRMPHTCPYCDVEVPKMKTYNLF